jgi:hypothetical protein
MVVKVVTTPGSLQLERNNPDRINFQRAKKVKKKTPTAKPRKK